MRLLQSPEPGFLSEEQRAQAAALFDALLPGSSGAPEPPTPVRWTTSTRCSPATRPAITRSRAGATCIRGALRPRSAARRANGRGGLAALGREEVTALLGRPARWAEGLPDGLDQKRVFSTIRNHCIEGCFSDPRWRGNRDAVMWRWLGSHGPAEEFHRGHSAAEVGHGV